MRVLVLGAGFGGLELTTRLAEEFDGRVEVTLIDQSDAFVFGFSKLDVMFGRTVREAVRHQYRDIVKPGVRFVQASVQSIDPSARRVETDAGAFECDVLVVALGADLDDVARELVPMPDQGSELARAERPTTCREPGPEGERDMHELCFLADRARGRGLPSKIAGDPQQLRLGVAHVKATEAPSPELAHRRLAHQPVFDAPRRGWSPYAPETLTATDACHLRTG